MIHRKQNRVHKTDVKMRHNVHSSGSANPCGQRQRKSGTMTTTTVTPTPLGN